MPEPVFLFMRTRAVMATAISAANPTAPAGNWGTGGGRDTVLVELLVVVAGVFSLRVPQESFGLRLLGLASQVSWIFVLPEAGAAVLVTEI